MANNYWKTNASSASEREVQWPTVAQAGRQIVVLLVVVGLWSGLLVGFLRLTATADDTGSTAEAAAIAPTATEPTPETDTPTPQPTNTPAPTVRPTETAVPEPTTAGSNISAPVEASASPTTALTDTPSPTPPPTHTPLPPSPTPAATGGDSRAVSFSQEVMPIFEQRCIKCHGGEETEEGFDMTTHANVLAGGWNGSVLEPGNVAESYMFEQIVSGEMPKNEPRLLPSEIRTIEAWIAAGAPDN